MNKQYSIEIATEPQQVIELLEEKLYEHNSATINKNDGHLFSRVIRDENKNIIAGVGGWTWANACEITQLWVDERERNNRLGSILLEAAEEEAKSKGCLIILIRSYSFQAPHFYEKHGYKKQLIVSDFPRGYKYYILTKEIG
jgi:GNAT superfamily N-acetyltransferase